MIIDAIIISDAKDDMLDNLTENTIQSLRESEFHIKFNMIVVEKQRKAKYMNILMSDDIIVQQPQEFNYNKCLNFGLKRSTADYIMLLNNDLQFEKGSVTEMIRVLKDDILSVSPMGKDRALIDFDNLIGYGIRKNIFGWCIMIKKEVIDKIGSLDESHVFWFSDDAYAKQLEKASIKHSLVPSSRVYHLESKTLLTLNSHKQILYTGGYRK